jgi:hypothetical protein
MTRRPRGAPPRRRGLLAAVFAVALCLAVPVAASAAEWNDGDVFVGLISGEYNVYDNGGTLQETISQGSLGFAVDCAFDRAGVLHTTAFGFSKVVRFRAPHPHTKLADVPTGPNPESVSFARDGSFYVGHQANPNSLRKFTGAGTPLQSFTPANPATMLDLSADQRTMFYTSTSGTARGEIHRFHVVSGADLPDFTKLGSTDKLADFKLLPPGDGTGGAILSQVKSIKRVDGSGRVVKEYDVPARTTGSASRSIRTGARSGHRPASPATSSASTSPRAPSTAARSRARPTRSGSA